MEPLAHFWCLCPQVHSCQRVNSLCFSLCLSLYLWLFLSPPLSPHSIFHFQNDFVDLRSSEQEVVFWSFLVLVCLIHLFLLEPSNSHLEGAHDPFLTHLQVQAMKLLLIQDGTFFFWKLVSSGKFCGPGLLWGSDTLFLRLHKVCRTAKPMVVLLLLKFDYHPHSGSTHHLFLERC